MTLKEFLDTQEIITDFQLKPLRLHKIVDYKMSETLLVKNVKLVQGLALVADDETEKVVIRPNCYWEIKVVEMEEK